MAAWHGHTFRITGPLWGESIGHNPLIQEELCLTSMFYLKTQLNKQFPVICEAMTRGASVVYILLK